MLNKAVMVAAHRSLTARVVRLLFIPTLTAILLLPWLLNGQVHAASMTWSGGCGTGNTNWSCASNWSGGVVPGSGDTVTFNSTSTNNSVVDASFAGAITTININSGYTGTITLARSLTVSTTFSQAAGTFTASNQPLTVATFTLSGGSFTASSATTNVSGAMTISGSSTFNANGGTVNISGTTTAALACNNVAFNLVTFTHTAGTKTVNSNCNLPLGNNPTANGGSNIANNGTLSGTGTLTTSGTLTLGSGGSLSGFSGLVASILTINGVYGFGSYTTFSVASVFTLNSGATFTAPSGTASFGSNFTLSSGATFNANGGTINIDGTTSATVSCNGAVFNLVTFTHTAGTKTVGSSCNLPLGNNPFANSGGSITNNGTLSGTGMLTTTSGTLTLGTGSSLSGFSGLSAGALIVNGTYNFGSYTPFTVSSTFTVNSGGSFTAPTGTASFGAGFTINSGSTFNANGGTINFNGVTNTAIACNNATFNLVTFTRTGATTTVNSDCNLPLGNNPTTNGIGSITNNGTLSGTGTLQFAGSTLTLGVGSSLSGFSGLTSSTIIINGTYNFGSYTTFSVGAFTLNSGATFTAPSGTATFKSGFTINSGSTFNANGGTVNFYGTASGTIACNNTVFNLVTFTNTAGTKTVGSDCNLPLGNNPFANSLGSLTNNGILSGTGLLTTAGTLTLGAGSSLSGFSGLSTNRLTVNGTYDFGSYTTFLIAGIFTLNSGGVFTAPTGIASFGNAFTISSGSTFNANGGTVNFYGATITANIACNNAAFNLVTFTHTSAARIVGSDCSLPLGNNPFANSGGNITNNGTLSGTGTLTTSGILTLGVGSSLSGFSGLSASSLTVNGTYNFGSYTTFSVANALILSSGSSLTAPTRTSILTGNLSNSGTFNPNGGTVLLNGVGQSINGSTTFYNLTKTTSSTDTLTFNAGDTTTVLGKLTLTGVSGGLLSLVSDTPGSPWYLNPEATTNLDFLDASDSVNTSSQNVTTCDSVNGGGNTGWIFNPASCNPTNGSGSNATLTNFLLLQDSLNTDNQQKQKNTAVAAILSDNNGGGGLSSRLNNFLNEFPEGKTLIKAARQFLIALAIGLAIIILVIVIWWLVVSRRRKRYEEEETRGLYNIYHQGGQL